MFYIAMFRTESHRQVILLLPRTLDVPDSILGSVTGYHH
jgi:hypothetical protein